MGEVVALLSGHAHESNSELTTDRDPFTHDDEDIECARSHLEKTRSPSSGMWSTPRAWSSAGWRPRSPRGLRGKHKPIFAPHVDTGDFVIVVNASKVVMTADKAGDKFAYHHSGYPGGITSVSYAELLATKPEELVRRAVRGMLPKTRLGRQQLAKLKVYAGPDHPHEAQQPQKLDLPGARRRQEQGN